MVYTSEAAVVENLRFPNHNCILTVEAPEIACSTRPGQFVMAAEVGANSLPYPLLKRALAVYDTVSEAGAPKWIRLLLKTVGEGTRRIASMRRDDRFSMIGPLGNGFDLNALAGKRVILAAGGTGIASVLLPARYLKERGQQVRLVYGGRSRDDLVGLGDFESCSTPVTVATEDGSLGMRGRVTDALEPILERESSSDLHLIACGPNPMMEAVSRMANGRGLPCQISVEAKMACGFGVCLGCTVQTTHGFRLACTQGPVFSASEFVWEREEAAV